MFGVPGACEAPHGEESNLITNLILSSREMAAQNAVGVDPST